MGGRAKMRHPAREKQRGLHHIVGIEAAISAEKVARMIQSHDYHDKAAQNVYGSYPRRSPRLDKASYRGSY